MSADPNPEKAIFLEAVERYAPEQWPAFLDRACAGQPELRGRVEALLEAHREVGTADHRELSEDAYAGPGNTVDAPLRSEQPGAVIGSYKLIEPIGEGGMGTVYMAEQTAPVRRSVALKVIKPGMDSRQVLTRFEAERQAIALMDHPNIARVLDAGTTGLGRPFFVMELVKGLPITQFCDERRLTLRERLELFVAVCRAVQHAHQKGIIHRDIKPSNVLVGLYDGVPIPKVIDFGVAKAMGQRLTEFTLFTGFGSVVGTPEYMSPEQAQLDNVDIDTRSDIYSLGVLLYELLTGTTPIDRRRLTQAAILEVLRVIREEDPPQPSTRLSSTEELPSIAAHRNVEPRKLTGLVRGELDWIVMKALEKDRNRRYETANGLAADLLRYLSDEPISAGPPSAGYRLRKFARRNRLALAAAAAIGLTIGLAMIALAVSYDEKGEALREARASGEEARRQEKIAGEHANQADQQRAIAVANEKQARAQTSLANRRLYASQMNLAMQASISGELARVLGILEGQRPTESGEDLRGFEWYYLWRRCHGGRRVPIRGHSAAVLGCAFSPDGRILASASWDGTVRLWDTTTGDQLQVLRYEQSRPWTVAFSPDGRLLATGGHNTGVLILWDVATGKPLKKIPGSASYFSFTPDGKRIAGRENNQNNLKISIFDVSTGQECDRIPSPGNVLGFTRDEESLIAFTNQYSGESEVQFWDVEKKSLIRSIAIPGLYSGSMSPDRSRIVLGASGGTVVLDSASGEHLAVHPRLPFVRGVALSPDNRLVACATGDRRVVVLDVATGQTILEEAFLSPSWVAAFSPDGSRLASASLGGAIRLRDLGSSDETTSLSVTGPRSLRFSADGRRLYVANDARTKVIDVESGREIAQLPQSGITSISDDLGTLARVEDDGRLKVWATDSGRMIADLPSPRPGEAYYHRVVLSPDGQVAVTHRPWREPTAIVWDLATGEVQSLKSNSSTYSIHCAAFSPDGSLLAAGLQFGAVTVWNLADGRVHSELLWGPGMTNFFSVAFSQDGRKLAAGSDVGSVLLIDTETGGKIGEFEGHAMSVRALAFSPDGQTLATGCDDHTIRLWDTETGQERCTLSGHTGGISLLRFSPDGMTLASGSDDGTIRLWRGATDPAALDRRHDQGDAYAGYMEAFQAHQTALRMLTGAGDAQEAVEFAKKAVSIAEFGKYWLTLGIAHLRAGQHAESLAAIDRSVKLRVNEPETASFVRSMALWHLGRKEEAEREYLAASGRVEQVAVPDRRTAAFQVEAAALLGQPEPNRLVPLPPVAIETPDRTPELRRRLAELDEQLRAKPANRWARRNLGAEYLKVAGSLREAGDLARAEAAGRSSYALFVELVRDETDSYRFVTEAATAADFLCDLLLRANRKDEALPVARVAMEYFRAARVLRPDRDYVQDWAAGASRRLADLLHEQGDPTGVKEAEQETLAATQAGLEARKAPAMYELIERARPCIEKRDWVGAVGDIRARLGDVRTCEEDHCFKVGLLLLLAGDTDGYVSLAARMPREFLSHEWPFHSVRALNLHDRGASDPEALVDLAREALLSGWAPEEGWGLINLATALYRAGDHEEALVQITRADPSGENRELWPIRAMIHHRLGQADEARRLLSRANEAFRWTTEGPPENLKAAMTPYWEAWAYFEVQLREANALIEGEAAP